MYSVIEKVVKDVLDNRVVMEIMVGVISSTDPFTVAINQKRQYGEAFLTIGEHLQEKVLKIGDREYILTTKPAVGDEVIVLKIGTEILLIDRVGDPHDKIIIE